MKKPLYSQDDVNGFCGLTRRRQDFLIKTAREKGNKIYFKTIDGKKFYTAPNLTKLMLLAGWVLVEGSEGLIKWIKKENRIDYIQAGYKVIEE